MLSLCFVINFYLLGFSLLSSKHREVSKPEGAGEVGAHVHQDFPRATSDATGEQPWTNRDQHLRRKVFPG